MTLLLQQVANPVATRSNVWAHRAATCLAWLVDTSGKIERLRVELPVLQAEGLWQCDRSLDLRSTLTCYFASANLPGRRKSLMRRLDLRAGRALVNVTP